MVKKNKNFNLEDYANVEFYVRNAAKRMDLYEEFHLGKQEGSRYLEWAREDLYYAKKSAGKILAKEVEPHLKRYGSLNRIHKVCMSLRFGDDFNPLAA